MDINGRSKLPKVIFLMGPTASGKTKLAIKLRKVLPVELISVDSALIYQGMDIGTAKPSAEELYMAPHRLIDILDPAKTYSASEFLRDTLIEIKEIILNGRIPLLVGGTMFYYKVLLNGLSPLPPSDAVIREKIKQQARDKGWEILHKELKEIDQITASRIHPNDLQRITRALEVFFITGKTLTELTKSPEKTLPYRIYQFAISPTSRILLHERINRRFYQILASGFKEEVQTLLDRGDLNTDMPSIRCTGYRQMWSYLKDEISYDEMIYQSICATRQLAKRQITWLRSWKDVHWINSDKLGQAYDKILRAIYDSDVIK